jgi:hypothetical protein
MLLIIVSKKIGGQNEGNIVLRGSSFSVLNNENFSFKDQAD